MTSYILLFFCDSACDICCIYHLEGLFNVYCCCYAWSIQNTHFAPKHLIDHISTCKCHIKSIRHLNIAPICNPYSKTICLLYDLHMETTLHSHMPAAWYQYGIHMVKPYSCHIGTTQEAWYLYSSHIAKPYICHVASIWQPYS